jgi:hypothetical protein
MNKLVYYLRRTAAVDVVVDLAQVGAIIGGDRARDLADFIVGEQEVKARLNSRRSAIPKEKRIARTTLASFKLKKLLNAIDEVKGSNFQAAEGPTLSPVPDPNLLSNTKVEELTKRGLYDQEQIQSWKPND